MIRFSALLLCAFSVTSIALPFQAAQAQSAGTGTASTKIDLSALDLNSTQDWHTATQRVALASHTLCQQLSREGWQMGNDVSECEQDAFTNARDNLFELRSEQKGAHQSGHVILALSTGQ
ncbi:UrcA family protein [Gluconobacter sp. Dm-62]|uniref:UrcA family protein n=1 Tax=Gluconobacter sp. Dm-62 TaxID=2799804 RepID=UPI001B8ACA16|nr:UrcA family protein [Gluconobacter sp. Dm-62]MBS1102427.1 UrcA family protein [Gluconobacter sp. Dm-62]